MMDVSQTVGRPAAGATDTAGVPTVVDRATFQTELDALRVREKAQPSLDALLIGRRVGMFYLVCYLRHGDRVFETYWTNGRGDEAMDNSYGLLDLTVYGRQETFEDSPAGWPQRWGNTGEHPYRTN